jgi:FlaA1/EpsC-like NDP-sugar epimerase
LRHPLKAVASYLGRSRNRSFLALDAVLLSSSTVVAYLIHYEGWQLAAAELRTAAIYIGVALPLKLLLLIALGLYGRLWRYASIADVERIVVGGAAAGVAGFLVGAVALPSMDLIPHHVPLAVLYVDAMAGIAIIALPRLLVRIGTQRSRFLPDPEGRRAIIAGAGAAGGMIARELVENPQLGLVPVGFVDDDVAKHRRRLHNIPVLGPTAQLSALLAKHHVDEVIVAMPTAPGRVVREVVRAAHKCGVQTRTVPGIYEIISGRKSVSALRQIEIQDLLRREPINTDLRQVSSLCTGETVLVTGAGGSIGSELCRQLARLEPARLVALGRGENSIFELVQELGRSFPHIEVTPVIADVRDFGRLEMIFDRYRPYSVFHAAAHKHVPLMEQHVSEAIINNVLGTKNVVTLASWAGSQHFVLVSTDKAIRPTSVMGATKRIAEGVVHELAEETNRNFVAVRFGNVLGSRGSVVPTFLRQIAEGGPVTITHPEMRRYFMTIPEAVQLVLQAGALAQGSEVFVLDMGEQVKIVDLAADLIRLSGLEVGTDIEIRFTGARPGEKLYEELFFSSTNASPTAHPKILRANNADLPAGIGKKVDTLIRAAQRNHAVDELRIMIAGIVPEYQPRQPLAHELPEVAKFPAEDLTPLRLERRINA